MGDTSIEWTDKTWNPTRGCSRVSPGCENCYAEAIAARFSDEGHAFHGFARRGKNGPRWTRRLALVDEQSFPGHSTLSLPLRWRKPHRIFVNSMSDLFHEALTNEQIAAVFGVMAAAPQHTFQVLTKRAERMADWYAWAWDQRCHGNTTAEILRGHAIDRCGFTRPDGSTPPGVGRRLLGFDNRWPLPNVWMGVSTENQECADERIPHLLTIPAAVRFVSYEPALGPVSLFAFLKTPLRDAALKHLTPTDMPGLSWVIVGGESGRGARPFHIQWARDVVGECTKAHVAVFVKQMGAKPLDDNGKLVKLRSAKGGDPSEWPTDLRTVRQWPAVARAA
jgi:protein gp37